MNTNKSNKKKNYQEKALAAKNSKISESMKLVHQKRREQAEEAKKIEEALGQRLVSISNYRDVQKYIFTNITADQIRGILNSTRQGYFMTWSDACDYIMEMDPQIKGMVTIRTHQITGKKILIDPADETIEAKQAADFIRKEINKIPDFDRLIRQMLMGIFKGVATAELVWKRNEETNTFEIKEIASISQRRLKVRLMPVYQDGDHFQTNATLGYGDWVWSYWNYGDNAYGEGIDVQGMFPGKFLIYSPGDEIELQYRGIFRTAIWAWFFKQAGTAFWAAGIEKYAFPVTWASVPKATPENVRYQLSSNLNNLANDASVVVDEDVDINTINTGTTGGDNAYKAFVEYWDSQLAKLILGSTLTIQGGTGSANRSLGEVGERTIQDLVYADACSLAEMLKHQLVKYLLEYNTHLFGGVCPPIPNISFDVEEKNIQPIDQLIIDANAITVNEVRKAYGLSPWTSEQGGENVAKSATTAAFSVTDGGNFNDASTAYATNKPKTLDMISQIKDKLNSIPVVTDQEIAEEMGDKP